MEKLLHDDVSSPGCQVFLADTGPLLGREADAFCEKLGQADLDPAKMWSEKMISLSESSMCHGKSRERISF